MALVARAVAWVGVGLAIGGAVGFVVGRGCREVTTSARATSEVQGRAYVPREDLVARRTILVGRDPRPIELDDGSPLVVEPAGTPRTVRFDAHEVAKVLAIWEGLLAGWGTRLVASREPGRVVLKEPPDVEVRWREGTNAAGKRELRFVAIPTDPTGWESQAAEIVETLAMLASIERAYARMRDDAGELTAHVVAPRARPKMPFFDAAQEELKAAGLTLVMEDVLQAAVVQVVRDRAGEVVWVVRWEEDQQTGSFSVRHQADPFDAEGERALLLAILRRAYGRDVEIRRP